MPPNPDAVSPEQVAGFWNDSLDAFARAQAQHGGRSFAFRVAGHVLGLEVIGEKLESLLVPALRHCRLDGAAAETVPDLTVYAFDTACTGVAMPVPVWANDAYSRKEALAGFDTDDVRAAYNLGSGVFNLQNAAAHKGIYWIRDAREHPQFEQSSPLRVQLAWWLRRRGRYLIHGGAVAQNNRGIILVGRGGSGKSTSVLACLNAGWQYLGDDYILFGLEPAPVAYNLYGSAKLNVMHLGAHFPQLADAVYDYTTPDRHDKAILMLENRFQAQLVPECHVQAVVIPQVRAGESTRLSAVDPRTTSAGLIPSTLHQLPPLPPEDVRRMMQLVQRVPNYRLEIGGSPHEIPAVLAELIA